MNYQSNGGGYTQPLQSSQQQYSGHGYPQFQAQDQHQERAYDQRQSYQQYDNHQHPPYPDPGKPPYQHQGQWANSQQQYPGLDTSHQYNASTFSSTTRQPQDQYSGQAHGQPKMETPEQPAYPGQQHPSQSQTYAGSSGSGQPYPQAQPNYEPAQAYRFPPHPSMSSGTGQPPNSQQPPNNLGLDSQYHPGHPSDSRLYANQPLNPPTKLESNDPQVKNSGYQQPPQATHSATQVPPLNIPQKHGTTVFLDQKSSAYPHTMDQVSGLISFDNRFLNNTTKREANTLQQKQPNGFANYFTTYKTQAEHQAPADRVPHSVQVSQMPAAFSMVGRKKKKKKQKKKATSENQSRPEPKYNDHRKNDEFSPTLKLNMMQFWQSELVKLGEPGPDQRIFEREEVWCLNDTFDDLFDVYFKDFGEKYFISELRLQEDFKKMVLMFIEDQKKFNPENLQEAQTNLKRLYQRYLPRKEASVEKVLPKSEESQENTACFNNLEILQKDIILAEQEHEKEQKKAAEYCEPAVLKKEEPPQLSFQEQQAQAFDRFAKKAKQEAEDQRIAAKRAQEEEQALMKKAKQEEEKVEATKKEKYNAFIEQQRRIEEELMKEKQAREQKKQERRNLFKAEPAQERILFVQQYGGLDDSFIIHNQSLLDEEFVDPRYEASMHLNLNNLLREQGLPQARARQADIKCDHKCCGLSFKVSELNGDVSEANRVIVNMERCKHHFHQVCLENWLKHQLNNKTELPLSCPACRNPLYQAFIDTKVQINFKLREFAIKQLKTEPIPDVVKCPTLKCSGRFQGLKSKTEKQLSEMECSECSKVYCINCRSEEHKFKSCADHQRENTELMTKQGSYIALLKNFEDCDDCQFWKRLLKCEH